MHTLQFEITKPTDDSAFEDMCARIYSEVFNDPLPKINGRRGQAQAGIDVFVNSTSGRIGIQCKRYVDGTLKLKDVQTEIERADKANTPIVRLIVATTAVSDAKLLRQVQDLSDDRVQKGQYPVEVEFWEDICRHIRGSGKLQRDYAPNAPGAMFHRQEESNLALHAAILHIESKLDVATGLPGSRPESVDKFISSQLDGVNELLKACRFRDASDDLNRLGSNLELFDAHQKARWYLQRGLCNWHLEDGKSASGDFLKSAELYPGDEKMAAAGVRGFLLRDDVAAAVTAGAKAWERFPSSVHVWLAYANGRMLNGENLTLADAPVAMRGNCDVLQLLAWARKQAGDLSGAIELSGRALDISDAGFFVRRTALGLALEAAQSDTIKCAFGLVPADQLEAVERAVAHLNPRKERVWNIQSPEALADTLVHLGYAYIILDRAKDALELVDEARHAGALSPRLMRVALDAYRRLDHIDDLLSNGRDWLGSLEEEALVLVAEVASDAGDVALVSAAAEASKKVPLSEPETPNLMIAMKWMALWRSKGGRSQAIDEVKAANLGSSASLPLICGGARILHLAGEEAECEVAVSRAVGLVNESSPGPVVLLLADLLFAVGKYLQAAKYYEQFAVKGQQSGLHSRLLACYVRGGARRKARELLQSLPGDWAADDEVRGLALELGQIAADWDFLVPLAQVQCERSPKGAGGWLLRLVVDLKTRKMHRFHQTLDSLPDELEGSHRQITQLASLELKYDRKVSGMKRLYRLFRRNMDDLEAASGYFIGIVAGPGDLPNMEEELPAITDGSAVQLEDEYGGKVTVSIDPKDAAPVPARDGFYAADSFDIGALLGMAAGSIVELPGPFNTKRKYLVKGITSVYRQLLHVAQGKFQTSMSGEGVIASLPITKTEQGADFSHMHAMLKRQTEHSKQALDTYVNGPLTLGILAQLLGRSVVDVVSGWPSEDAPLFVCSGTQEERQAADQQLEREQAAYVVDAATIAELVWLGCQAALSVLPQVYCSTKTLEVLEVRLEEAQTERSGGQVFDDGGVMRYVEFTDKDRERRIAYCQALVEAVRTHCEVVPAYGPEVLSAELQNAEDVLANEEYSTLLLVAERDATLLTIDGRLAQFAVAAFGGKTVWPQVLLRRAAQKGLIAPTAYSMAVVREFVSNRNFVSLAAYDLVMMCLQGAYFLRMGLQHFKDYLTSPSTELGSAVTVAFEFLQLQVAHRTQFKAFLELFGHIVEAVLRHPGCDAQAFVHQAEEFARDIALTAAGPDSPYPPLSTIRRRRFEILSKALQDALISAGELAARPVRRRAIKLKTLMCMSPPWLGFDGAVRDPEAAAMETDSPPTQAEAKANGGETATSTSPTVPYMVNL
jgi:tetratricopeptide (TPR) repeat protein